MNEHWKCYDANGTFIGFVEAPSGKLALHFGKKNLGDRIVCVKKRTDESKEYREPEKVEE